MNFTIESWFIFAFWFIDDTSDNRGILNIYSASELKCRQCVRIFFFYFCGLLSTFFLALIFAILDICFGKTDTSAWNLPFNVVVPFETESVLNWLLEWLFQISSGFSYTVRMILTTTHFVCCCYYIMAVCEHFNWEIDSVRQHNNTEQQIWQKIREKLQHAVGLHINIYE